MWSTSDFGGSAWPRCACACANVIPPWLQVRSLSETVRLDARTKLLNPKWYEGMLNSGYEGVREIQKRLTNTVGWSATSGQVRCCLAMPALCLFMLVQALCGGI